MQKCDELIMYMNTWEGWLYADNVSGNEASCFALLTTRQNFLFQLRGVLPLHVNTWFELSTHPFISSVRAS